MLNVAETKTVATSRSEAASRRVNKDETKPEAVAAPEATKAPEVAPEGSACPAQAGIKLAKDVAMPESSRASTKYPWATMQPGDAFFVPGAKLETFWSLTNTASKKHGHKFTARRCKGGLFGEADVDGVGVWCL